MPVEFTRLRRPLRSIAIDRMVSLDPTLLHARYALLGAASKSLETVTS